MRQLFVGVCEVFNVRLQLKIISRSCTFQSVKLSKKNKYADNSIELKNNMQELERYLR